MVLLELVDAKECTLVVEMGVFGTSIFRIFFYSLVILQFLVILWNLSSLIEGYGHWIFSLLKVLLDFSSLVKQGFFPRYFSLCFGSNSSFQNRLQR